MHLSLSLNSDSHKRLLSLVLVLPAGKEELGLYSNLLIWTEDESESKLSPSRSSLHWERAEEAPALLRLQ